MSAVSVRPAEARHYGLDLLRMVSMCMVVVLHLLGQGGVLRAATPFTWGYLGAWLMEAAALCAVNCYGLLSGYLSVGRPFAYGKYLPHWLQAAFWSVVIYVAWWALWPALGNGEGFFQSFFPVLTGEYWYFTAFTAVFFLRPFLDLIVDHVDRGQGRALCTTLVLLFSVGPFLADRDTFVLKFGYSALWLVALYLMGGCLRRFGLPRVLPPWGFFGVYLLAVALSWGGKLGQVALSLARTGTPPTTDPFLQYTSPLILLAALALLHCFLRWHIRHRGVLALIRFFAPASFGVYLIHTHPMFWHHLLGGAMAPLLTLPAPAYLSLIPAIALGVFLVCACAERLRLRLFRLVGGLFHREKER